MKSWMKRFLCWYRMETPPAGDQKYVDTGVLLLPHHVPMIRVESGKAKAGTYRFGENGIYHFSKRDAGQKVMIFFREHGEPKSRLHTIGL